MGASVAATAFPLLFLAYMVAAVAIFLLVMPLCLISLVNIALQ